MSRHLETWRPAPGFPDYLVSDEGRVMRATGAANNFTRPGRIIKTAIEKNGYERVNLYGPDGIKRVCVHALVCEAFHGPKPTPAHEVAHGDGNKANNRPDNLRWATRSENHADKHRHGTAQTGEANGNSRLTAEEVRAIRIARGTQCQIAAAFGVSQATVSRIRRGDGWMDAA